MSRLRQATRVGQNMEHNQVMMCALFPIRCLLPLERPGSEDLPRGSIVPRLPLSSLLRPGGLLTEKLMCDICLSRTESCRASPLTSYPIGVCKGIVGCLWLD